MYWNTQMCIGCALCVEICTTLGPDVLRVKPVEGWKRGKAFVFNQKDVLQMEHASVYAQQKQSSG
jgi:formate hydrogenlyase subunit 6/NADH:ubiquinone oxidoreductase subunit I